MFAITRIDGTQTFLALPSTKQAIQKIKAKLREAGKDDTVVILWQEKDNSTYIEAWMHPGLADIFVKWRYRKDEKQEGQPKIHTVS